MKSLTIALFFFLGLVANVAAGNFSQIMSTLPNGGYMMDMEPDEHGLVNITDLDGKPIPGSPFHFDSNSKSNSSIAAPDAGTKGSSTETNDQWGCAGMDYGEYIYFFDWRKAGEKLGRWCDAGNKVADKKITWWVNNQAVAYICNYAGRQNCKGIEYWSYMEFIADKCNTIGCGWYLQGSGDKSYGRGVKDGKSDPHNVCYNI